MNIARIKDGVVVNIEVASQEWIDANQGVDGFTFAPYTDAEPVITGAAYDADAGFTRPESGDEITVTKAELDVLVADEVAKVTEAAAPVKR